MNASTVPVRQNALQAAKRVALAYFAALEAASASPKSTAIAGTLEAHFDPQCVWYGVHPFNELQGIDAIAERLWEPLFRSLTRCRRYQDVFFAGFDRGDDALWVVSMGHFYGLFDQPWLGIPGNGRLTPLRYAEFLQIEEGKIRRASLFVDIIGFMQQAGLNPLPVATGRYFVYPGPRTHDGLLMEAQPPAEGEQTLALIDRMVDDLDALNNSGDDHCPPEYLARTWHDDMVWYGPAGIGATYTIARYQQQHQYPFREGLTGKRFNGHLCRVAEGHYGAFFGWPNLNNTPSGGFLGLPASDQSAPMRVVDVYRRQGDLLIENWVLLDFPYWLLQQGLDVLTRTTGLISPNAGEV